MPALRVQIPQVAEPSLDEGVTDLQRAFRGIQARKQVVEFSEPGLVQGVTDLQRAFRGIQARKQVFEKVAESGRQAERSC